MKKRLFLGFSPDTEQIQSLLRLQSALPGPCNPVPPTNLHMTLAFLGPLSQAQQQQLIQSLNQMDKPSFSVTLDKLCLWQKPRILCLTGAPSDPALKQMATQTQLLAAHLGLHQSEYDYQPHITLCRKAHILPQHIKVPALTLKPTQLHLYHSHNPGDGVRYRILKSWPLDKA